MGIGGYAVLIVIGITLVLCMVIGIKEDKKKADEKK